MSLRGDPSSIAPERALVLEVVGSVGDFYKLVQKVKGLEFLADEEGEFDWGEETLRPESHEGPGKPTAGRLYLAMPDVQGLKHLLSLWKRWQDHKTMDRGFAPWKKLFGHLHNLRPWGPLDRISDSTIRFWEETESDREIRRIEAELWFREDERHRKNILDRVADIVAQAGGEVIDHAVIEEIGYDGALIDLPASEIRRFMNREEVSLVMCDDVMFLRPQSSVEVPVFENKAAPGTEVTAKTSDEPPIAALLDGVPVQKHKLLDGHLQIDDPEKLEGMSTVEKRVHGTAMASLILHGDRALSDESLISRKLHVRPVLYAPEDDRDEESKRDRLVVDVIYRAIKRMKDGDEEDKATAPEVFLVNISLGDVRRPFARRISPWAKLLDHLADRYGILFLVSAGNILDPLPVKEFSNWTDFENADPKDRMKAVLEALSENKSQRTILSPAEALNVLTVGAWHEDALDGYRGAGAVDPYEKEDLPNVTSALGLGHRKVLKPDVHLPGGREHVTFWGSGGAGPLLIMPAGIYGLQAASPPDSMGDLGQIRPVDGTSAATALATRAGHRLFDMLMNRDEGSMHADMEPEFRAVVIKALLVHGATWGNRGDFLEDFYGPHGQGKHVERRDNIARLLGYGLLNIDRVLACTSNRATLVGPGIVAPDKAKIHSLPLPPSLDLTPEPRAITVTLAWFSPINHRHQAYRQAKLEVSAVKDLRTAAGVKRKARGQPSDKSTLRGTVFHTRYEGEEAVKFVDDGQVKLRISCSGPAGPLDQDIRYGIAVTIEAGEHIQVYDEIRTLIQEQAPVPIPS